MFYKSRSGVKNFWLWYPNLGILVSFVITFFANCAIAEIIEDVTLPNNSQVTPQGNLRLIAGGTRVGSNLFHSFQEFSVLQGMTAEFKNAFDVENIISRVTGNSISHIDGILKTNGNANLFLINPHGIIFGANASLDINGSFIASTASSVNFDNGTQFSTTDSSTAPLLTVSAPIGLQFGANPAPIRNLSQASSPNGETNILGQAVGLQVPSGKTLALVGGDIILDGGNLTAKSGRIELGSVAGNSLVNLKAIEQGWQLGYEDVQNFQNIQLIRRNSGSVEFASQVDTSGKAGGNIQVQGKTVELIGSFVRLISQTTGVGNGQDLNITTEKLIIRDGAQVGASTSSQGDGGNLIINASESVELTGSVTIPGRGTFRSLLFTTTGAAGNAGNITINTDRLRIRDKAGVSAQTTGSINERFELTPATGKGGNLTVNAFEFIELMDANSGLFASTNGFGAAGKVTINTDKLIIGNGAEITVSSEIPLLPDFITYLGDRSNLGPAGELNVSTRSILLDNKGKLSSNSDLGQGGDITLQVRDLLLMRRESQISTNAGTLQAPGNGGNITINAPKGFIVAAPLENSDITANAFSGSGGKITINANSIFGFVQRTRADLIRLLGTEDPEQLQPSNLPTSDITAFSLQNPSLSGTVEINTPDVDPNKGLVELPINIVDVSQQVATGCHSGGAFKRGSFVVTGRGGIATNPTETLMSDTVLADWIPLEAGGENRASGMREPIHTTEDYVNSPNQIVEAQGWVIDANGNVVLVAQTPTVTHHSPALNSASCAVN
ncbi:MAG: filamentous hemagglutinin N-terminal domain-containing protein [Nodularia sp. CChRGM 3473]